jgi:hypothetical protein
LKTPQVGPGNKKFHNEFAKLPKRVIPMAFGAFFKRLGTPGIAII